MQIAEVLACGAIVAGRYRVVRPLKVGGMGAVYEVVDQSTNRRRALKHMLPAVAADLDLCARFRQEATVAGRVESEHIVEVFDAGVDPESRAPFLVMELLRGEDLGALVHRGRLSESDVVRYLHQVALGLDKTHAENIVHRDLKLENLFLTRRDDGSPWIKILDFGIAKVVAGASANLHTTRTVGTPVYMAPEQLTGDATIDARADLYAMGHLAYTMLVGAPYWEQELRGSASIYPFIVKVVGGSTESARARAARAGVTLPEDFDAWFLQATAREPDDWFGSAIALARALSSALSVPLVDPGPASPVSAAPPSASVPPPEASATQIDPHPTNTTIVASRPIASAPSRRGVAVIVALGAAAAVTTLLIASSRNPRPAPMVEAPAAAKQSAPVTTAELVTSAPASSAAEDPPARPAEPSATSKPSAKPAPAARSPSPSPRPKLDRPAPVPHRSDSETPPAPVKSRDPLDEL